MRRQAESDAERDDERDEADAGAQCAVAHDVLHVQADQHGQREHHAAGEEDRGERRHPVAVPEQVERHHRVVGGALDVEERDQEHHRRHARTDRQRRQPALLRAHREAEHRGGAAERGQDGAGGVELQPLAVRLTQRLAGQVDHQQADRDVDQERPAARTPRSARRRRSRPITEPTPVIAAKTAVAALRAGPLGNVVAISARRGR